MSNDEHKPLANAEVAADIQLEKEKHFHAACYRFNSALVSARTVLTSADDAPGQVFFLAGEVTPETARDLHARWASASCVLREALDDLTKRVNALVLAVQALLSP